MALGVPDIERKVVAVNSGKKLHIDIIDGPSEDAPTLFFMHGLGGNTCVWEAVLHNTKLREKFRLVRYDFDGHGLSPVSSLSAASGSSFLALDDLVDDLGAVMDYVKVDKAAGIVGHSMSGLVASHFAARNPERVEKLVLLGAMAALHPATQMSMLQRASTVISTGTTSVVNQIIDAALSDHTKATSPLSIALVRSLVLATHPPGYAAACRSLAGASNPDYSAIKAKTLIVAGEEDYLSNKNTTQFFKDKIEDSEVVTMDKVGHWHAVEDPVKLREILEGFFL